MGEQSLDKKDLADWADFQAKLIRDGQYETLDYPWIAEELEGMRSCHKRVLRHALADLCFCIALNRSHPETKVWCYVQAGDANVRAETILDVSPSLEEYAKDFLDDAWKIAVGRVDEMFPGSTVHPANLGYTLNALRNRAFIPELERPGPFTVVGGNGNAETKRKPKAGS